MPGDMESPLDGSDSDIECIFVSVDRKTISGPTTTTMNQPEVVILSDDSAGDLDSSAQFPDCADFLNVTPIKEKRNPILQPPPEEWEVLFGSGSKAPANLSDVEESFSLPNPADVAVLLGDDPDATLLKDGDASLLDAETSGRRSGSSDIIWDDPPPTGSSQLSKGCVEVAAVALLDEGRSTPVRSRKRHSNCLVTPKAQSVIPSEKRVEPAAEIRGEVPCTSGRSATKPPKKPRNPMDVAAATSKHADLAGLSGKDARKEQKRLEKEALAEQKRLEKEEKLRLKEAAKLAKESDKQQKQAMQEISKTLQGGKKSLHFLRVQVPRTMLDAMGRPEFQEAIAEEGEAMHVDEVDAVDEAASVIRWTRMNLTADADELSTKISSDLTEIEEKDIMIQISKKNFVSMVDHYVQMRDGVEISELDRDSFISLNRRWEHLYPGKVLHYFAYGMESYFRNQLRNAVYGENRPARAKPVRRSLLEIPHNITYDDMEEALLDMGCRTNRNFTLIDSPRDFARMVITFHKAIANANFKDCKRQESNLVDFITANTKTTGVFVPDEGDAGYRELWIRQLEQFSLVSHDKALALVELYPSPRLLMRAYDACATVSEKERLVEDVTVRSGAERRIGPKMSRMLYAFICSLNGDDPYE
ncbi:putative Crossover junction endonuclease EME1 [Hypsibius exemplaris]|uniref:Crossover junction endonuclease EME1 n=1 Tax=Hypsibius exemplaris TaxID=2072580 RepID=A0A1W0WNK1_HYPEX|nr:putative Crossover junction endonuclease EME1 [Hypsibius exemplaris]